MTRKKSTAQSSGQRRSNKRNYGGTLIGLFVGLVIGLLCAFGIAWYLQKSPLPFQDKGMQERKTDQPAEPVQLPGMAGQQPVNGGKEEGQRFEFYKILPSGQMSSSTLDDTTGGAAAPAPTPRAQPATASTEDFYLQAGAFQQSADANNQKARLALMGFEAGVFEADTVDKGVLYRVRIGPFSTPEEMNLARNQLSENGVPSTVVKIKRAE